jgi:hypothetical protein
MIDNPAKSLRVPGWKQLKDRMGGQSEHVKRCGGDSELITASEIACFAYCPERWRLAYGLELLSGNPAARNAGARRLRHSRSAWRVGSQWSTSGKAASITRTTGDPRSERDGLNPRNGDGSRQSFEGPSPIWTVIVAKVRGNPGREECQALQDNVNRARESGRKPRVPSRWEPYQATSIPPASRRPLRNQNGHVAESVSRPGCRSP